MKEIYYLEDDSIFNELARNAIETGGKYKLTSKSKIEDFWKLITPGRPKDEIPVLIILDVDLGEENCNAQGGDIASMIANRPELESVPVLFLTGLIADMNEVRAKVKEFGQSFNFFYEIEGFYYTSKALSGSADGALLQCIEEVIEAHQTKSCTS